VRPSVAIISAGRHNVFGHPAPSTIETLLRFGARVYRTDENGAVTVTSDGKTYTVAPMLLGRTTVRKRGPPASKIELDYDLTL
jgi:beta-lactamase superfamily II metal-dependent hydrolase